MTSGSTAAAPASRRLLFLCNNATYFLAHWGHRAAAAVNAGFEVRVGVPNADQVREPVPWTWVHCALDRRSLGPVSNIRNVVATRRLIADEHPSLVVAITVKPNLYATIGVALGPRLPLILNVTGLGFLFLSDRVLVRVARAVTLAAWRMGARRSFPWVVFENADDQAMFVASGIATPGRTALLGGAGVDLDAFEPSPEDVTDVPVVLLPARLLWDKGVGEFVEASRLVAANGVAARFVLVGGLDAGNPSAIDESTVQEWVRAGLVEWWGLRDDMAAVYRAAHVVCLPSYREGLSRALLEAAASRRPVVTTDVAGCRDAVQEGVTGLLVPVRDARALAAVITRLVNDAPLRLRMGAAGRTLMEREFGHERVADRTIALYRVVADESSRMGAVPASAAHAPSA